MDISGVRSRVSSPLPPNAEDLAAVLAARVAMNATVSKAAATATVDAAVTLPDEASSAAAVLASGKVDMYL
jgi:hypothetical protein